MPIENEAMAEERFQAAGVKANELVSQLLRDGLTPRMAITACLLTVGAIADLTGEGAETAEIMRQTADRIERSELVLMASVQ